jgi:NifU-like protein involved in Fe-S cluster formation
LHFGCTSLLTNSNLLFSWCCGKCFKELCLVGLSIGFLVFIGWI